MAPLNPTKLPRHNLIQRIIPSSIIVITHIIILITITIIISTTSLDLILSNKRLAVGVNDQDNPRLYPSLTSWHFPSIISFFISISIIAIDIVYSSDITSVWPTFSKHENVCILWLSGFTYELYIVSEILCKLSILATFSLLFSAQK